MHLVHQHQEGDHDVRLLVDGLPRRRVDRRDVLEPGRGQLGEVLGDGRVERENALVDELECSDLPKKKEHEEVRTEIDASGRGAGEQEQKEQPTDVRSLVVLANQPIVSSLICSAASLLSRKSTLPTSAWKRTSSAEAMASDRPGMRSVSSWRIESSLSLPA